MERSGEIFKGGGRVKKENWQVVGIIGVALGLFFIVLGIFAHCYKEESSTALGYWIERPFLQYRFPLVIVGVILFGIGMAFAWRAEKSI